SYLDHTPFKYGHVHDFSLPALLTNEFLGYFFLDLGTLPPYVIHALLEEHVSIFIRQILCTDGL
ncbi:hypothetical protein, partial [Vibrio metschnikovii]|uniref:hypothetical protein n=1 Tax=Vibrio metschnikovii TaxID=28172 RepID=UPI002FC866C8